MIAVEYMAKTNTGSGFARHVMSSVTRRTLCGRLVPAAKHCSYYRTGDLVDIRPANECCERCRRSWEALQQPKKDVADRLADWTSQNAQINRKPNPLVLGLGSFTREFRNALATRIRRVIATEKKREKSNRKKTVPRSQSSERSHPNRARSRSTKSVHPRGGGYDHMQHALQD